MWVIPTYYVSYSSWYVRISDDSITDAQDEYLVLVAKNQASLKQYKISNNIQVE